MTTAGRLATRARCGIRKKKIQYRPHLITGCLPTTGLGLFGLIDELVIANST
ncbi:hypothetical protein [Streptomyces sp. GESEQ-35]|uniref:hypothetical protein n=1 Tax=Streptomyces sp. GESEQ-35 TaxID=2812657 RepID=UPI001B3332BD|nr:hypothetical protein [Streptomyces sp. GESEQ-35]